MMRLRDAPARAVISMPWLHALGAGSHGLDSRLGVGGDAFDHLRDFAGGVAGGFGEAADFTGDDGKAAALFAGAGGFDGGVESEQIGFLGDFFDDVDDADDLLGFFAEALDGFGGLGDGVGDGVHAGQHLFDDGAAFVGDGGGLAGLVGSGLGVAGDFGDGDGHFLHGAGGLVGLRALLAGAIPGLGAGAGQIFAVVVERGGSFHDRGNHVLEAFLHGVDGVGEVADLIVSTADDGPASEVAFGDGSGTAAELAEAGDEAAGGEFESDEGKGASDHGCSPEGDDFGAVEMQHLGEGGESGRGPEKSDDQAQFVAEGNAGKEVHTCLHSRRTRVGWDGAPAGSKGLCGGSGIAGAGWGPGA